MDLRELECFLVLAEELHFGRTAQRLYLTQSRVSQLLRALERRIGAVLVQRTSRVVRLSPAGERFLAELRPAYAELSETVQRARRAAAGVHGSVRIGFQGTVDDQLTSAIAAFEKQHPQVRTEVTEIPLGDPFGPLQRAELDAAVVLLPVCEPDLVLGPVLPKQPPTLALARDHPLADRGELTAEDLAGCPLIGVDGPAPEYWRRAWTPDRTPAGTPLRTELAVRTIAEGLTLAAANRGGMLLCRQTADYHNRENIRFVPVTGLPASNLGLVWSRHNETENVRAFARALGSTVC
ncbi:LysR family transcriptional regulator [Sciscionella sediminilitoris]|uniref:LysR substrate-binding domain-containing protein n=1 Tax=Sciscionella sediminilitoris TaxID=1445613 RepID=UPI000AE49885|nr:LysR family transcriptional regulator [Sciscionella sp. SE31]